MSVSIIAIGQELTNAHDHRHHHDVGKVIVAIGLVEVVILLLLAPIRHLVIQDTERKTGRQVIEKTPLILNGARTRTIETPDGPTPLRKKGQLVNPEAERNRLLQYLPSSVGGVEVHLNLAVIALTIPSPLTIAAGIRSEVADTSNDDCLHARLRTEKGHAEIPRNTRILPALIPTYPRVIEDDRSRLI